MKALICKLQGRMRGFLLSSPALQRLLIQYVIDTNRNVKGTFEVFRYTGERDFLGYLEQHGYLLSRRQLRRKLAIASMDGYVRVSGVNPTEVTERSITPVHAYWLPVGPDDDVYTRDGFITAVDSKYLIDYDGMGYPARHGLCNPDVRIRPSNFLYTLPEDATHVVWFNK